ncbi:MAG: hypothetical protein ABI220_04690 [Candidatus Saccharimonadales bacterium]
MAYKNFEFDRAVVAVNPKSTNSRRVKTELSHVNLPLELVETNKDPRRTLENLQGTLRHGTPETDLIIIAGGDGVANQIGNMALANTKLFARGGDASDGATMLNGRKTLDTILRTGKIMNFFPIDTITESSEGSVARKANWYFGAANDAAADHEIDLLKDSSTKVARYSGLLIARQFVATMRTMGNIQTVVSTAEDGVESNVSDRLYTNGDRIAKIGRPNSRLDVPEFESFVSPKLTKAQALLGMAQMLAGKRESTMMTRDYFMLTSPDGSPIYTQYDGEVGQVESGSKFTIGISPDSYSVITTRY